MIITLLLVLSTHTNAMEVFERYVVSNIEGDDMTHKIINACLQDTRLTVCKFAGNVKKSVNMGFTLLERKTLYFIEDYLGVTDPVAAIGYLTKVVVDKKIRIEKFKHIPYINNDSGTLELSEDSIKWIMSWNF